MIYIEDKKKIFHKKIQLWTNDKGNEYAISLLFNSNPKPDSITQFIASTNPNEKYTHLIAETDNIQNLQHGWNYTLRKLIEDYKENHYNKVIGEGLHSSN
jgi:hypothetical protein